MKDQLNQLKRSIRDALRKHNVEVIDAQRGTFACGVCGNRWTVDIPSSGRMPDGWWRCANGCNTQEHPHD